MSLLSRLFGSKSTPKAPEAILHKDCRIIPEPIKEGAAYRIAGRIEKEFDGQVKTHRLIRADTRGSLEEAVEATIGKGKLAIDQLGDTLFE